jgi:phosphoglycolate phosphatase-like HAD superfamily hydrolase
LNSSGRDLANRPVVIVDIDGTIADVHHRLHHIEGRGRNKNWKAFFEAMDRDPPIPPVIAKVRELAADNEIVMLTGRPEDYRQRTVAWLERHDVPFEQLLMRPGGDRRSDFVTKEELLATLAGREIRLAIDDRAPVCEMYRRHGLDVWEIAADESAAAETNEAYRKQSEA